MKIKKYIAETMPEAMNDIRKDLGPNAVILNSKEIWKGGILGFFKKKKIEVIAALDPNPLPAKKERQVELERPEMKISNDKSSDMSHEVLQELKNVKKILDMQVGQGSVDYPVDYQLIYSHLIEQEVEPSLAKEIVDKVIEKESQHTTPNSKDKIVTDTKEVIIELLEDIPFGSLNSTAKIIQFVGPTGVGKTTTIAKVASNLMLKEHKKIAFITSDTYRIAAIEQLKTYARILNVPLEVAYTVEDFKEAVNKLQDYDVILVDTAGRNFRESKYIQELKSYIDIRQDIATYLVLSLTSKPKDLDDIFNQFHQIPLSEVIFTKMDETTQFGSMLSIVLKKQIGIAFVTNGQDVPNDILNISPQAIADSIVGDSYVK
ncbi:flagellar biosynthesis protein FlhF [Oceanobacillus piezotolerans]|uniref:Flagellar biosynthesis protein FlhF n=1 Tax=Oceanobacillus piezotolerans TaxID=2448030 RepID=A0A498DC67_9BACI|nr:flagellar biosynthesis protein FlhF [Oceanobacillus piezotolerans]RLL45333.1 flagellar biosynthesis protein FlhF [Oceanobacillus piezotolerans]